MHLQGGVGCRWCTTSTSRSSRGECVVLGGPSGAGKSSILKMIFGNYRCDAGEHPACRPATRSSTSRAPSRAQCWRCARDTIGYVSQFLRAIPRVPALDIVAEPLVATGVAPEAARARAGELLRRLNIPQRLWALPPATFSGGEQQRINIARGFLADKPLLLLDEPTASLDAANRAVVVGLINEKKRRGAAIVAIVHDDGRARRDRRRDHRHHALCGRRMNR